MSLHPVERRALEREADVAFGIANELEWDVRFLGQQSAHELTYWEERGYRAAIELEQA